jgi:drug/metabolite transporter (DMT)-like permease
MSWFFYALIPPFLYAITNHIDKTLLKKYFKEDGVTTLLIFSALLSILVIPISFIADPDVLNVNLNSVAILAGIAVLDIILIWAYLKALEEEESSIVIIFYQMVPVMALVLGYYILGETISQRQLVAMGIIILGTSLVSLERSSEDNLIKLKKRTIFYMLLACSVWALESVIFKAVALEENVWRSLFWEHIILAIFGILMVLVFKDQRQKFVYRFRQHSSSIVALNVTNEFLYLAGNIIIALIAMTTPVALVMLSNSFQAIFVFIIGLALMRLFPDTHTESIDSQSIKHRVIAIIITGIGSYLLLS